MRTLFVALAVFVASSAASAIPVKAGDFTFVYVEDEPVRLPPCPPGCEVRLSRVASQFVGNPKRKRGWHKLLFGSAGMFFPKGGFVVYQRSTQTVLVASTADDLDLALALPPSRQPNHALQRTGRATGVPAELKR